MSEFPKIEKGLTVGERDSLFKQRLDTMLARKASDGEIIDVLTNWYDQEQALLLHGNDFSIRRHKDFVIRAAELKLAVGLVEWAIDDLYDAVQLAYGYGDQEVANELETRIEKIKSER